MNYKVSIVKIVSRLPHQAQTNFEINNCLDNCNFEESDWAIRFKMLFKVDKKIG